MELMDVTGLPHGVNTSNRPKRTAVGVHYGKALGCHCAGAGHSSSMNSTENAKVSLAGF